MSAFTLKINTDNDAFQDDQDELARCVRNVAESLKSGKTEGVVKDSNGNTVGSWGLDER